MYTLKLKKIILGWFKAFNFWWWIQESIKKTWKGNEVCSTKR